MTKAPLRERIADALLDATRFAPALGLRHTVARVDGVCRRLECLIATKRGLYVLQGGSLDCLLPGEFYGVTRRGHDWYVFQKLAYTGRLLRFQLDGRRIVVAERVGPTLSDGCHQIDLIGDELFVADTYENRLLVLSIASGRIEKLRDHAPFGRLDHGRKSDNYVHMNSLWRSERGMHVVLHNETRKTQRNSELAVLSMRGDLLERRPTQAAHAHNVIELRGKPLYCDSQNAALRWGDDVVFECDMFTRGLSVTPEHILVGGSEYGSRGNRGSLRGKLYVLDHQFAQLASIPVPGMVQEIRSLEADLGLSQCVRAFQAAR